MTILGAVFLFSGLVALLFRRTWFPWVLSAAAAFPTSAAIVFAGNALPPFYLLAILAVMTLPFTTHLQVRGAGRDALMVFVAWAVVITALGPFVFAGIEVLSPRGGIDGGLADPAELSLTVSHAAQIAYLLLAVGVVYYFVRRGVSVHVPAAAFGIGTLLSFVNLVFMRTGLPWPNELFDTAFATYQSGQFDGTARLRGLFAEPSMLAEFSIAGMVFFLFMALATRRAGRCWYGILTLMAFANVLSSATGTGVLAGAMVSVLIGGYFLSQSLKSNVASAMSFIGLGVILIALVYGKALGDWGQSIVEEKIGSDSQVSRFAADEMALRVFAETMGLGAGLGSNRPSSFAAMLISCVGIIGLVVFLAFVLSLIRAAHKRHYGRAAAWGLLAGLVAKAVAVPDLSSPYMWLLIAACASSCWTVEFRKPVRNSYRLPQAPFARPGLTSASTRRGQEAK